tara:strand:- start:3135 stop:3431 length:297 start_codon:yes stop_codon:yes gene_type:complete
MVKNLLAFFISVIIISGCATSDQSLKRVYIDDFSDKEIEEYNSKVEENKRIICKNEKPLGTNIQKRICKTVAQIKAEEENNKDALLRDSQRRSVPQSD